MSPSVSRPHQPAREDAENRYPWACLLPSSPGIERWPRTGGWSEWIRLGQSPPLPQGPGKCGVVVIQRWEGPRPLGRVRRLGEGRLASALRERQDQQRRRRSAGPQNRMSCSRSATSSSMRLSSGEGAGRMEDVGLPSPPLLARARNCLGMKGRTQA